jgi:DNA-binding transcriptional LysR family regulator
MGRLRIGFVASATPELIPKMTIAFRKHHPDVALELKNIPTLPQLEALRMRTLDVGIVRLPLREPDLEVFPLSSEPFAIIISKQHRLRTQRKIAVRDLEGEPSISYSERLAPAFFQHWTGLCRKAGYTPRISQEVSEMETALALISAGVGVGIMPEGVARRYSRSLILVALKEERIRSEIGLAYLKLNPPALVRQLVASTGAGFFEHQSKRQAGSSN